VRELTPREWGEPGRIIHFYIHTCASRLENFTLPGAHLLPIVERFPKEVRLSVDISKDQKYPDDLQLYSAVDGEKGPHLLSIILEKQSAALEAIGRSVPLLANGKEGVSLLVRTHLSIDFQSYQFRQLRYKYGCVIIRTLDAMLLVHVSQSTFHFDRGSSYDIAAVVEDFVTSQKTIVSRRKGESVLDVRVELENVVAERARDSEPMANDSVLKICCAPYVSFDLKGNELQGTAPPMNYTLTDAG